jgi:hypothetical protein
MNRHGDYRKALPFWRTDFGRFLIVLAFILAVIYFTTGPIDSIHQPSAEARGEAAQWAH